MVRREYRLSRTARRRHRVPSVLFQIEGSTPGIDLVAVRRLARAVDADYGELLAAGMLHEAQHRLIAVLGGSGSEGAVARATADTDRSLGSARVDEALRELTERNPPLAIVDGGRTVDEEIDDPVTRGAILEEAVIARIATENPALIPFHGLFVEPTPEPPVSTEATDIFAERLAVSGPSGLDGRGIDLIDVLRTPAREAPHSLAAQLRRIRDQWGPLLGDLLDGLQLALDVLAEQDHAMRLRWATGAGGGDDADFHLGIRGPGGEGDEERFSADRDWMPRVVLIAKSTYVWLDQLSRAYGRDVVTLDAIPDEELAALAARGITGLWLIGLWQRSHASARIKHLAGDADAVASAYSLDDYRIADDLGGETALAVLREQAMRHGIRLASDMVPNHMGLDSRWVVEHPERFLSLPESPVPSYRFEGPDVSSDAGAEIRIEDGYWDRSDAAVVFQRRDRATGDVRYVYHGNDGTSMPWNDTAQLDYLRADVREAVAATIVDVARRFPIIRFDAAMTLARRHIQRLWYPPPGGPGDAIPTRVGQGVSEAAFARAMPHEFWREVVDRIAVEAPDTLLLAEAFWMLEGYFVRTLGMHRVYNSAFMHMLRDERNAEYRALIKETLAFEPEVLKRFVNFLNNPDERTAVDQFGDDDRYFCAATLMATLPGLPMFGHGQFEGYAEKYGMEFRRARWQEEPKDWLVERHGREIVPLLHRRRLFAEVRDFWLYDLESESGVAEDVYAFSNRDGDDHALVLVHSRFAEASGTLRLAAPALRAISGGRRRERQKLATALGLPRDARAWVVFRDLVSGQEGMRNAAAMHDDGFTVVLRAYERRVLVDWRVVLDEDGAVAELASRIGSDGSVASIDDALDGIRAERRSPTEAADDDPARSTPGTSDDGDAPAPAQKPRRPKRRPAAKPRPTTSRASTTGSARPKARRPRPKSP
ncbi:MAG TPA: alpha-amylase family glycosyl hydrolase [Candidatus Limnocylindrales bacterium]|jgi:glycosidase